MQRHKRFRIQQYRNTGRLASIKLLKLVTQRLEGYETLQQWLKYVMGVKLETISPRSGSAYTADTKTKLKATRLAWIDNLIEEFK